MEGLLLPHCHAPLVPRIQVPGRRLLSTPWCPLVGEAASPARDVRGSSMLPDVWQSCSERLPPHRGTVTLLSPGAAATASNVPFRKPRQGLPQGLRSQAGRAESPRVDSSCRTPRAGGGAGGSPAHLLVLERPRWGDGQQASGRWVGSELTGVSSCRLRVSHRGPNQESSRTSCARLPCPGGGSAGSRSGGGLGRDSRMVPVPRLCCISWACPAQERPSL